MRGGTSRFAEYSFVAEFEAVREIRLSDTMIGSPGGRIRLAAPLCVTKVIALNGIEKYKLLIMDPTGWEKLRLGASESGVIVVYETEAGEFSRTRVVRIGRGEVERTAVDWVLGISCSCLILSRTSRNLKRDRCNGCHQCSSDGCCPHSCCC